MKSKTGILVEALARKKVESSKKVIELRGDFPQQNAFINDEARYIAAQCSRRAGKTNGLAIRFLKMMEKRPKCRCVYLGLTFESARDIMMPVMKELNDTYDMGLTFLDSSQQALVKHPNGSQLKIIGANMSNFITRLKGRKHPAIGIDEAQDFSSHLQSLVDDVLTPCIADYEDGWLALTGTPGPVPQGYFFDVTQNHKYGYSHHEWTIMDNPFMPNPQAFLADLKLKREWTDDNPTLQREWLNKWVLDAQSLWIQYSQSINNFDTLPLHHDWHYVLGVDIGFRDADAIAVVAWSSTSPNTYLIEESVKNKQTITGLVADIDRLQKKYNAYKIVMDEGGLGKKIAEDIRQRFGCPLEPADKAHKQDNVALLNDALRLGKFKADKMSRFAQDSYLVQIDWPKSSPTKIVLKKDPHSDIIDAVLYAFRESYSYAHTKAQDKPTYGSRAWAQQQTADMFEKELEGYQKEQSEEFMFNKWLKGE